MSRRFLLDTNAAIAITKENASILAMLSLDDQLIVPIIVIGEMQYGAQKSARVTENLQKITTFLSDKLILYCDLMTAEFYGRINAELAARGRPIPQNDLWIAALAAQYALTVLTQDRHFLENAITGVNVQTWA